jgi:hypothetical protein
MFDPPATLDVHRVGLLVLDDRDTAGVKEEDEVDLENAA